MEPLSPLGTDPLEQATQANTTTPTMPHSGRKTLLIIIGIIIALLSIGGAFAGYSYYTEITTPKWSVDDIAKFVRDGAIEGLKSHAMQLDENSPTQHHIDLQYRVAGDGKLENETSINSGSVAVGIGFDGYVEPLIDGQKGVIFDTSMNIRIDAFAKGTISAQGTQEKQAEDAQVSALLTLKAKSPDGKNIYFSLDDAKLSFSGSQGLNSTQIKTLEASISEGVAPFLGKWYVFNLESDTTKALDSVSALSPFGEIIPNSSTEISGVAREKRKIAEKALGEVIKSLDTHSIFQGVAREQSPLALFSARMITYDTRIDKEGVVALLTDLEDIRRAYNKDLSMSERSESPLSNSEKLEMKKEIMAILDTLDLELIVESDMAKYAKISLSKLDIKREKVSFHLTDAIKSSLSREEDVIKNEIQFRSCNARVSSNTGELKNKEACKLTIGEEAEIYQTGRDLSDIDTGESARPPESIDIDASHRVSRGTISGSMSGSYTDDISKKRSDFAKGQLIYSLTTPKNTKTEFEQLLNLDLNTQFVFEDEIDGQISLQVKGSQLSKTVEKKSIDIPKESLNILSEAQKIIGNIFANTAGEQNMESESYLQLNSAPDATDVGEEGIAGFKAYLQGLVTARTLPEEQGDNCMATDSLNTYKISPEIQTLLVDCTIKYVRISPSYYGLFVPRSAADEKVIYNITSETIAEFASVDSLEKVELFRSKYSKKSGEEKGQSYLLITP